MMRRNPGFATVVVLVIGLGIGATTGIFSVVNAVLLRPMQFKDVDRLVMLWETRPGSGLSVVAPANYPDWKSQSTAFEQMAIIGGGFPYSLVDVDEPSQPVGTRVSPEFFSVLGVHPLLGRTFTAEEASAGGAPVVILSHGIWQRWYGSDPGIVGKTVALANVIGIVTPCTVVGVMPAGLRFPENSGLWLPYPVDTIKPTERGGWCARVVAKLKPGTTRSQAQAEMNVIAERLARTYPESNRDSGVRVTSLREHLVQNVRLLLYAVQGAALLVLVAAVANVVNLLLGRSTSRGNEAALRAALGANRWRIVGQLMIESLLLSMAGGTLGLLAAYGTVRIFGRLAVGFLPRAEEINIDGKVLCMALLVSVGSGLLFGLAPAVRALRADLAVCLRQRGVRGGHAAARSALARHGLVVAEIALSLMLLAGAGLCLKSFLMLSQVRLGFEPAHALTVELGGIARPVSDELIERLTALPGVQAVGATDYLPISESNSDDVTVEGGLPRSAGEKRIVYQKIVTPGYFRAMGITLLKGRRITQQDTEGSTPVVVVNEAFVRRLLGQADPIGARLADKEHHVIVGVVGDTKDISLEREAQPQAYYSYRQKQLMQVKMIVRTEFEPTRLAGAVCEVVRSTEKDRPILSVQSMRDRIDSSIMPQRFQTSLVTLFSVVGLILAAVGIYGMVSYSVSQRIQEFGIRMALGARGSDVLRNVIGQGLRLALTGLILGLLGALALTRLIASLLYNVSSTDPLTFTCVSLLLTGVALLATYIPARRAARTDPMVALRYE